MNHQIDIENQFALAPKTCDLTVNELVMADADYKQYVYCTRGMQSYPREIRGSRLVKLLEIPRFQEFVDVDKLKDERCDVELERHQVYTRWLQENLLVRGSYIVENYDGVSCPAVI